MTRYSGAGDRTSETAQRNLRKAVQGFVRNQGGSRGASAASPSGKAAAAALGRFTTDVARRGWTQAVSGLGLDQFLDQPVEVLVAALVETLSPRAGHVEDDLARRAMAATLANFLEDGSALASLDALDEDGVREVLMSYIVEYVDQRLMHTLGDRVEAKAANEKQVIAQEKEIRDFVERDVERLNYDRDLLQVNWEGDEGREFIDSVFTNAYRLMGEE